MTMQSDSTRNTGLRLITSALLTAALSGCSLWGSGSDNSEAEVTRWERCKFDLRQAARAAGRDDADVVEQIQVDKDCNVTIDFRQTIGDSVGEIEDEGSDQILGSGVVGVEDTPDSDEEEDGEEDE